LNYLDGLRGLAACWVMVGHSMQDLKWNVFLLGNPSYAVELFMMISGFLMYYHAINRSDKEPLNNPRSWVIFWTRRFFRIAPVYYVMLAVAFVAGPHVAVGVRAGYEHMDRYYDHSWQNILAHYTFVFGAIPKYHHDTALPDWSIGLEMMFYAAFPFIALLLTRVGTIRGSVILTALCYALWAIIPSFMGSFVMASFLPLRLPMFLAGILIAETLFCEQRRVIPLIIAAMVLAVQPTFGGFGYLSTALRILMVGGLSALAAHDRLPVPHGLIQRVSDALSSRVGFFLGEISYGVYLTHSVIILPVAAALQATGWPPAVVRLALLAVAVPTIFTVAWVLHVGIERRGIAFGRRCIERLKSPGTAAITEAV
jgi:peptidoglycan/LPS O-acetylase OafA/YrhL